MTSLRILVLTIVLLALGGLGGSFQPSRLLLVGFILVPLAALIAKPDHVSPADRVTISCFALIALFGTLSLSWTLDFTAGVARMAVVLTGMSAAIYVATSPKSLSAARRMRDAWSIALALTLPPAVYELATGYHFAFAFDERAVGGGFGELPFASVFFGNFNDYCTFISLALPMAIGSLESVRHRTARYCWASVVAASVMILAINLSRLALVFVAWLAVYYLWTRKRWRRPAALVLAFAAAAVLGSDPFDEEINALLAFAALKFTGLTTGDESTGERVALLEAGLSSLRTSFGVGLGVGGLEVFLQRDHPDLIPNPHNLVMELGANFGAIPVVAFVGLLIYLYLAVQQSRLPGDLRSTAIASLPFVPAIGAISSQAIGYTYWWLWVSTIVMIAGAGQSLQCRNAVSVQAPSDVRHARSRGT